MSTSVPDPLDEEHELTSEEESSEISGGVILDLDQGAPVFDPAKHRAETASRLAFLLIGVLVGCIVLHYLAVVILGCLGKTETLNVLDAVFGKLLPALSGFVGGAVTYYFARDRR